MRTSLISNVNCHDISGTLIAPETKLKYRDCLPIKKGRSMAFKAVISML